MINGVATVPRRAAGGPRGAMLSGRARKDLADQDAVARRNQLSLARLDKLCASEQFQAAKAQEKAAYDAAVSRSAVEHVFKSQDAHEVSLEAARARFAKLEEELARAEEPALPARDSHVAPAEHEEQDFDSRWAHITKFDSPAAPNTMGEEGEEEDEFDHDAEPVVAWGASGKAPGLFTDGDGSLRFVAAMTRCPGLWTLFVWFLAMGLSYILWVGFLGLLDLGELITQGVAEYDMLDVRSIKQDSLQLAIERTGAAWDSEVMDKDKVQRPMSETLTTLTFIYVATEESGGTIFHADAARELKQAEATVIGVAVRVRVSVL